MIHACQFDPRLDCAACEVEQEMAEEARQQSDCITCTVTTDGRACFGCGSVSVPGPWITGPLTPES